MQNPFLRMLTSAALVAAPLTLAACQSADLITGRDGGRSVIAGLPSAKGKYVLRRTPADELVSVDEVADALASADVVFLGELHDSTEGHAAQLALTRAIAERNGEIILSMEMLERDAQARLDLYLDGLIDEERFVAGTRLWGNWKEHYAPAVEFARANGYEVVAANVYRPLASRVAKRGLAAGLGDPWAAVRVDTGDGEYKRRFLGVMGGGAAHGGGMAQMNLDAIFAAQCLKDDTMAESIAEAIAARKPGEAPTVVHWNGRFHSDFGLGTVERLKRRMPHLNVAVVSMVESRDLSRPLEGDELSAGHFMIVVPPAPQKRD